MHAVRLIVALIGSSVLALSGCASSSPAASAQEAKQERRDAPPATSRPAAQPATTRPAGEVGANPPAQGFDLEGSDARAIEIADAVMAKMGGRAAWDRTRHLSWDFFGSRRHRWDKHTGNIRIEGTSRSDQTPYVILMNVHSGEGRAFKGGEPLTEPAELDSMLQSGKSMWINDSYWLVMPYKLKDSGVTLKHLGPRDMADGRPAEVLELRFRDVGDTPENKYHVYVSADSGLVEQWDFFRNAGDEAPAFSTPWRGWTKHGGIMLCGDRGTLGERDAKLTDIAVHDDLPASVYEDP